MPADFHDPALDDADPTGRFTGREGDYVRFRPGYPAAAIDHLLAGLAAAASLVAADVGAGTGISARQLADRGVRVLAVEPNEAMRRAAGAHPHVAWQDGAAEATGLAAGSVDLVVCAQAFHWFRPAPATAEFHRILRPGGRLALIWNCRDRADPLTQGYIEAIHAVHGEHPLERMPFAPESVDATGLFTTLRLAKFPHAQSLDREGLLGRALSASYVPKDGAGLERLTKLLGELFDRQRDAAGRVEMRYVTEVWLAEGMAAGV